jgi:hypothetical protein
MRAGSDRREVRERSGGAFDRRNWFAGTRRKDPPLKTSRRRFSGDATLPA